MSTRNSQRPKTAAVWPYTPEPSPPLKTAALAQGVHIVNTMASGEPARARPISMSTRREGLTSPGRPTLEDVLNNTAPSPYTLAAYTAFLSQQHCLETLEFVTESRKYSAKYEEAAAQLKESSVTTECDQGFDLMLDWMRLLDVYVKPGAPREINIPAEERDDLINYPYEPTLPPPEALDPCVKRMYDLMSDSIFIPFCNSLKAPSHAQTYTAISELSSRMDMEPSRTFDDRGMHRRVPSKARKSSPPKSSGSATFEPSRSPTHRPTQSSSLSSALGKQTANRLSTHVSHSSAMSESALTDSSGGGGGETPPPGEHESVMTPPTTPPTSDLGVSNTAQASGPTSHAFKPQRSESGGWSRKMNKIFGGGNKKRSSFLDQ